MAGSDGPSPPETPSLDGRSTVPAPWDLVTWPQETSSFHLSSALSFLVGSRILKPQTTPGLLAVEPILSVRGGAPTMAHSQKGDAGVCPPLPRSLSPMQGWVVGLLF